MIVVGIVSALPVEARVLLGRAPRPGEPERGEAAAAVLAVAAGVGPERARRAAAALVARGAGALASFGLAGGLAPDLRPGHLVVPERVLDRAGGAHAPDRGWRAALVARLDGPARGGTLVESERVVAGASEKADLFRTTGAAAVDMESAAVALAAAEARLPFLCVRAICDGAGESLPRAVLAATAPDGRTRPVPLLAALLARPRELPALLSLNRSFRAALAALREVVARAGQRLAIPA